MKIFTSNQAEYRLALQLRYEVLRKPLGLQFTNVELEKDKTDVHFGLFEHDKILACLTLSESGNGKMKMRQVAVHPEWQGKGIGKQLAAHSEKYAAESGCKVMYCNARKTAVPFYEKMDYKVVSEEFLEVGIPHCTMEKQLKA